MSIEKGRPFRLAIRRLEPAVHDEGQHAARLERRAMQVAQTPESDLARALSGLRLVPFSGFASALVRISLEFGFDFLANLFKKKLA
jgi:hypothetical protein